jgi:hypothetical protein
LNKQTAGRVEQQNAIEFQHFARSNKALLYSHFLSNYERINSYNQMVANNPPTLSTADDEIQALYKKMAGRWGIFLFRSALTACSPMFLDAHYRVAGQRTLSGPKSSVFDAFLYKRRIIFRETVQTTVQERETTPDSESPDPSPSRAPERQRPRRGTGPPQDVQPEVKHLVRCCHCSKTWGLYNFTYTTTSAWKRHIEKHHPGILAEESAEREMIAEIRKKAGQTSTPWTKAAAYGLSGRLVGDSFKPDVYRRLLAEFIVESSSAFSNV